MGRILSKINKTLGKGLNDLTGATSAAELNNNYQRYFAENAHQMEVKDLEAAGINPILASGNGGNTASGGGTSGSAGISPIAEAVGVLTGITSAAKANAETKVADAQVDEINKNIEEKDSNIKNKDQDTLLKTAQTLAQEIQNDIETGAKDETIKNKKAQLETTWAMINKTNAESEATRAQKGLTEEQTKRIIGGWLAEKIGTGGIDTLTGNDNNSAKKHYLQKEKYENYRKHPITYGKTYDDNYYY